MIDLKDSKTNEGKISGSGEIATFNKDQYEFQKLFEEKFGIASEWKNTLRSKTRADIEEECYKIIDTHQFKKYFSEFLDYINNVFDNQYVFQSRPSIRVQKPKDRAAIFHIDSFTGHGKDLINFWIPLVKTNKSNTLWLVEPDLTKEMLLKTSKYQWTVGELDSNVRGLAKPLEMEYGQILVFSNKTLHGCVDNNSDDIRISFDFRALPKDSSAGTKNKSIMFNSGYIETNKKSLLNANTVVYCNHKAKHISHEAQRAVILDFCQKNNFVVHREDSDWHGCDNYLPLITEWSRKYPKEPIIIFSKLCLDFNKQSTINSLYKISKNMKTDVYFALEAEKLTI